MAILELTNLSYDYITKAGRVHAVKEATASFDAGVVYAIVGRSGSGKSTLMSLMAGLDVPKSGKILYEGTDLAAIDRDRYRREHVGMIFQSYYLLPQLTAAENVELALELSRYKGNRARARLGRCCPWSGLQRRNFEKEARNFPAASSSVSRLRARSRRIQASYSPTSRPAILTMKTAGISSGSLTSWRIASANASSSLPMRRRLPKERM